MGNVLSFLSVIVLIYALFKYRKELKNTYKKIPIMQLIGVIISYLIAIIIAYILIYYGGNWLVSYIPFKFLKLVSQVIIVIVVLSLCLNVLNKVLKKISKGIL